VAVRGLLRIPILKCRYRSRFRYTAKYPESERRWRDGWRAVRYGCLLCGGRGSCCATSALGLLLLSFSRIGISERSPTCCDEYRQPQGPRDSGSANHVSLSSQTFRVRRRF
jgi:hypothetical protein